MSTLSSVREIARADVPSFSFGRALALMAGSVVVGVEALLNRAEVRKSRRQLAELDDRLLRRASGPNLDPFGMVRLTLFEGVQVGSVRVQPLPPETSSPLTQSRISPLMART